MRAINKYVACFVAVLFTMNTFATTWIIDPTGTYTYIQAAYEDPGFNSGDTILLTAGYTYTGNGLNVNLTFTTDLIIGRTGQGADPIIDMESLPDTRFCSIETSHTVTISNVTIQNGNHTESGGAIVNKSGTLYVLSCTFSNNNTGGTGGAITNASWSTNKGVLNIVNCTFINNRADNEWGGAIINIGFEPGSSILNAIGCSFSGNNATVGGAILNCGYAANSAILNTANCSFTHNKADAGGAIANAGYFANSGILNSFNCSFNNNSAEDEGGGAIYNAGTAENSGIVNIANCTFINNSASNQGGAAYNIGFVTNSGILNATDCRFSNNNTIYGGAIFNYGDEGGGILNARGCIFDGNRSIFGGVLYNGFFVDEDVHLPGTSLLECCRFVDNSATTSAHVIYNLAGTVTAQNCWWATNNPTKEANQLFYGTVHYNPWIQMSLNVRPFSLRQPSLGPADLVVTFSPACIPDGTPVAFSITSGTIVPAEGTTFNGTVTAQASGFESNVIMCATAEPGSLTPVRLCTASQPLAPAHVIARQQIHRFLLRVDIVNTISWQAAQGEAPAAAYYEIYAAQDLNTPLAIISANARLYFAQHQRKPNVSYTYYLYAVTAQGVYSEPVKVTVP